MRKTKPIRQGLPKEFTKHFYFRITSDMKAFANDDLMPHYIFYKTIKKLQHAYCTHCNKEFNTTKLIEGKEFICPLCNKECLVKAAGRKRTRMIDEAYFVYYKKSKADPSAIVAYGIIGIKDYRESYKDVELKTEIKSLYLLSQKGCSFYRRYAFYEHGSRNFRTWSWEKRKSVYSEFNIGYIAGISHSYSRHSIKEAVKGTPFQYSGWEYYNYSDMTKFFSLYSKYPAVEYLTKLGFGCLVEDKLNGYRTYGAINWRGNSLYKVLKLTSKELKEIRTSKTYTSFDVLKLLQLGKKDGSNFTIQESIEILKNITWEYHFEFFNSTSKYISLRNLINYIEIQNKKDKAKYKPFAKTIQDYRDYYNDCITLGLDLNKKNILLPKNLHRAHQNTIKQVKIKENSIYDEKIKARYKSLDEKYTFENNGFTIRPAKSSLELIEEGQALNHCVGTYAGRYAKGEIDLLLIRAASAPDKPYFTAEIREGEIQQTRGKYNCSPEGEVAKFIKIFELEKLHKKMKIKKTA